MPYHEKMMTALDKVENSVERASRITHQLLGIVGKSQSLVAEINLAELVNDTLQLISHDTQKKTYKS